MKRHYALVLLVLLFSTTLSVAQVTVKFQKPASWTAVSLYTWGPEVLGGWPGAALIETDGWFTYTFDTAFTGANLIFNNAGAGEQTVDYVISSSVCLQASSTLNAEGKYDINVVACIPVGITVKFQKPASWTAVSLYTWGPEVLGGWPGVALIETDGWYTYTFDAAFTGANLIFNNAGAGEQTVDYAISASVCLQASSTLNAEGKYDVNVVACTLGGIKVKFQKPASWTAVSLYTWGPEALGGWPGATLTETDGWYTYSFDVSFTGANLIFNNAGAGEQTVDYTISSSVCLQASSTLNADGKYDVNVVACSLGGITINFQKPEAWTEVFVYAWYGPDTATIIPLGAWPGALLTELNGMYSYTFDASITGVNIIFSQNGSPQTESAFVMATSCFTSDGTSLTVFDCTTAGVNDVNGKSLTIYPNPIVDNINFSRFENIEQVIVRSIIGENVLTVAQLSKNRILDVKSLKSGVYFVSIYFSNGKQQTEKIIKF